MWPLRKVSILICYDSPLGILLLMRTSGVSVVGDIYSGIKSIHNCDNICIINNTYTKKIMALQTETSSESTQPKILASQRVQKVYIYNH